MKLPKKIMTTEIIFTSPEIEHLQQGFLIYSAMSFTLLLLRFESNKLLQGQSLTNTGI